MASKAKKVDVRKSSRRIRIGKRGEDLAASFLMNLGFEICERNWRKQFGELDIIARKEGEYRMVEVKTRTSTRAGMALEAITDDKLETMDQVAQCYFFEKEIIHPNYHLDVITIDVGLNDKATLRYLPDIQ